ncbi:MAG TPA: hypothetical protein VGE66_20145 [Chitinophagaceae bacterium]
MKFLDALNPVTASPARTDSRSFESVPEYFALDSKTSLGTGFRSFLLLNCSFSN